MRRHTKSRVHPAVQAARMAVVAFLAAIVVSAPVQAVVLHLPFVVALIVLLLVILLAVASDAVGVASTAAHEQPVHARAAKKRAGARLALLLIRNCDQVATFASDTVGDIAGAVTGAVVATLVVGSLKSHPEVALPLAVAILSAVTIFLKSLGKYVAVRNSDTIVMVTGAALEWIEQTTPLRFFGSGRRG